MDEEDIRLPDNVFRDQLVPSYDDDFNYQQDFQQDFQQNYDPEYEQILEESRKEYEKQIEKEHIKNYRINLFKKMDIQLNYLTLGKNDYFEFFIVCFNIEKEKFLENDSNKIMLFRSHYDYLHKFLYEIYSGPVSKNKSPKIDKELYDLLINNIKCI